MTDEETVLTSRRAFLRSAGRGWTPGRLRVSDRRVRFTASDGTVLEVARAGVSAVRLARLPRRALVLDTAAGPIRLRCFAMPAVAILLRR
ncbi:hypothetical protein [uncultured Amnibacterium sp.]|uniref:hypothetical protein n=1 Tax=uncultured Amnibacterium sp. TaxID=1631851 RepID=UPI0035CACFF0